MKIIETILSFIIVIGIASCFDALMNHIIPKDASMILRILIFIGKFSLGWFYGPELIKDIYKKSTK